MEHPKFITVWLHKRGISNEKNRTGTQGITVLTAARISTLISVL